MGSVQRGIKTAALPDDFEAVMETIYNTREHFTDVIFYIYSKQNWKIFCHEFFTAEGKSYEDGTFTKEDVLRDFEKDFDAWIIANPCKHPPLFFLLFEVAILCRYDNVHDGVRSISFGP